MKMRCTLCVQNLCNGASKKSEDLKLKTINGVDYLVCEFHEGGQPSEQPKQTSAGSVRGNVSGTSTVSEQAYPTHQDEAIQHRIADDRGGDATGGGMCSGMEERSQL